jgi:hypothetical protein
MLIRAGINLLLLLILLPFISEYLLHSRKLSAPAKDLLLLKISGTLLAIGSFMVSLAWTPGLLVAGLTFLALGSAFQLLARSLAAAVVSTTERGFLFTAIAVVTGIGQFFAGPVLANAFRKGMDIGGWAIGLPFMITGGLYILATLAVFLVRLNDGPHKVGLPDHVESQDWEA